MAENRKQDAFTAQTLPRCNYKEIPKHRQQKQSQAWQLGLFYVLLIAQSSEQAPSQGTSDQICGPDSWDTCPSIYNSFQCFANNRTVAPGAALRLSSGSDLRRGCKWIFTSQDSSYQCCYGNTDQCDGIDNDKRCRSKEDPPSVLVKVEGIKCSLQICDITPEDDGSYQSINLGVHASKIDQRTIFFISTQKKSSNIMVEIVLSCGFVVVFLLVSVNIVVWRRKNKEITEAYNSRQEAPMAPGLALDNIQGDQVNTDGLVPEPVSSDEFEKAAYLRALESINNLDKEAFYDSLKAVDILRFEDKSSNNFLHLAAEHSWTKEKTDMLYQYLHEHKLDNSCIHLTEDETSEETSSNDDSALITEPPPLNRKLAVIFRVMKQCLERRNNKQEYPLHIAARDGSQRVMEILLDDEHLATTRNQLNLQNNSAKSAINLAEDGCHREIHEKLADIEKRKGMCYFEGEGALQLAKNWLDNKIDHLKLEICDGVLIENQTSFDLQFLASNYISGYPVEDVVNSFKKSQKNANLYVLPPGAVGVQLWRNSHAYNALKWTHNVLSLGITTAVPHAHIKGYFSVRVKTPQESNIIKCGFLVGRNQYNKMGLEVSNESNESTGKMGWEEINSLVGQELLWRRGPGPDPQVTKKSETVEVLGELNNDYLARHTFIFRNVPKTE